MGAAESHEARPLAEGRPRSTGAGSSDLPREQRTPSSWPIRPNHSSPTLAEEPPPPPYSDSPPEDPTAWHPHPVQPHPLPASNTQVGWKFGSPPPTHHSDYFPGMPQVPVAQTNWFAQPSGAAMPVAERPSGSGTYPHYPAASSSPYIQNPPLQSSQPSGTYGSLATGAASASFPLGSGSHQQPAYTAYQVVHVHHYGLCSRGGDHELQTEFTLPGVLCALFCFPCGIPCCLCMTERRCVKCGARFD